MRKISKHVYVKYWESKNNEQRILLIMTLVFIPINIFIVFSEYFKNTKGFTYIAGIIIQAVLKFIFLCTFNKTHLNNNAIASIPYLGGLYSFMKFFKKP